MATSFPDTLFTTDFAQVPNRYSFYPLDPDVDFTYTINGFIVSFEDISYHAEPSEYTFVSRAWDFNDDEITDSTAEMPDYTYSDYGDYPVTLTITYLNKFGEQKTKSVTKLVEILPLSARFIEMENPTYKVIYYTTANPYRTDIALYFTYVTTDQNNNIYISGNYFTHDNFIGTPFIVKYNSIMQLQWYNIQQYQLAADDPLEIWNEHRQLMYDTNLNKLYSVNFIMDNLQISPYTLDRYLLLSVYTDEGVLEDQIKTIVTDSGDFYNGATPISKDPYVHNIFYKFDDVFNKNNYYIIRETNDPADFYSKSWRIVKLDSNGGEIAHQAISQSRYSLTSIPDNLGNVFYILYNQELPPESTITLHKISLDGFANLGQLNLSGLRPFNDYSYQEIKMAFNSQTNNLYIVSANVAEVYQGPVYVYTSQIIINITNDITSVLQTITCNIASDFGIWCFSPLRADTYVISIDIAIDANNDFYIVTTLFDKTTNNNTFNNVMNNLFVVIVKFNSAGTKIWERSIKTNRIPVGQDVLINYVEYGYGTSVTNRPAMDGPSFWSNTETNETITCTDTDFILCLNHRNGNFINDENFYIDDKQQVASGLLVSLPLDGSLTGDYGEGAFTYSESNYITVT